MNKSMPARGLVALLRLPYWLMTGGLSLLTAFAIFTTSRATFSLTIQTAVLIFFSMAFITSAGFAVNDYFDRESDAVIKPKRPIPSGALTLKQVIAISSVLFAAGSIMAAYINLLSFIVIAVDSLLLLIYSTLVKRKSGFVANILIGILTGTAFLYGETTVSVPSTISLISLSLYPIAFGTIGGNVLRDVLSIDGDKKVGYPTLPQNIGVGGSGKIAALFFVLTAVLAPLPYLLGYFNIYYLSLILVWSVILICSSVLLIIKGSTIAKVRKYERIVTMSMILLPLALIIQALSSIAVGVL
jgi:geranylgeranylglycerol-phosphate geranylgeranyltransferase